VLYRPGLNPTLQQPLAKQKGDGQVNTNDGRKLPDRKRFDKRSNLPPVDGQRHQQKKIIRYDADHSRLLPVSVFWLDNRPRAGRKSCP
jgi:hypothetical protein